jgi:carbon monoxide dehydrogenase subunit G
MAEAATSMTQLPHRGVCARHVEERKLVQFDGSVKINAPREKVWTFLSDPYGVSQCAPGVKSVEVIVPEKQFKVVAGVSFGSLKVTFDTTVDLLEQDPPTHSKVRAHGTAPGSAVDVNGDLFLSDNPDGTTELKWSANVVVVGTIASLASRLMGGMTRKLSGAFFDCIKAKLEA